MTTPKPRTTPLPEKPASAAGMKRQAVAKCGTESGYNRHYRAGEHCNACSRAKAEADARRRNAKSDSVIRNRAHAKAQHLAKTELTRNHEAEYAALYAKHKAVVYAAQGLA